MGEAFGLGEVGRVAIVVPVVTVVGLGIQEVEEGGDAAELGVVKEAVAECFAGDAIEHVGEVQEEEGPGGVGFIHVAVELGSGDVYHQLEAAWEGDPILAVV